MVMPLSEHEQKLLEQMEQALIIEDPRFASTFRSSIKNANLKAKSRANLGVAVLGVVAGIVALITGVAISQPLIGVAGFVVIVLSLTSAFTGKPRSKDSKQSKSATSRKSFMQGLEERWDNRHQQ